MKSILRLTQDSLFAGVVTVFGGSLIDSWAQTTPRLQALRMADAVLRIVPLFQLLEAP
jgi:hypothetical protein